MASSVLPVGNHRVFQMFLPGHARLIHTLFEQTEKLLKFRNYKYCYIQVVNINGADQTAQICRQVDTLKFVVRK